MASTSTTPTFEEIKKAVFYSKEKPELLATIIANAVGVSTDGTDTSESE